MKQFARLALAGVAAAMATKVTVYEGPKECEAKDKVEDQIMNEYISYNSSIE